MSLPHTSRIYEAWAPFVARFIFGFLFLAGASLKIPGTASFAMEVAMTASAGVPFATIAVLAALVVEALGGIALILGWHIRVAGFLLAILTLAFALIFHSNFADPNEASQFFLHMAFVAGLLYVSVYGARSIAVMRDR